MRTFIALDLDERLKDRCLDIIHELDRHDGGVKWVSAAGMHITLKFLGEVSDSQTKNVKETLNHILRDSPSFSLHFFGLGTFPPHSKYPRVLWIGIDKNEVLQRLQSAVEDGMASLGFPKENRSFSPHLTLGRVKNQDRLFPVLDKLQSYAHEDFGEISIRKVLYYKSTLKPTGAEYSVLSEFALK